MPYLARRYLGPLALIAVSFAGLLIWLRTLAPSVVRHAVPSTAGAATHSSAGPSVLTSLTDAAILGLHIAALIACALVAAGVAVGFVRLRARRQRAETGRVLCAELRLGRDDQASPYEISKVFDGIAGALRPGIVRRPLIGPPTLALKIVSEGGARSVRFLVVHP